MGRPAGSWLASRVIRNAPDREVQLGSFSAWKGAAPQWGLLCVPGGGQGRAPGKQVADKAFEDSIGNRSDWSERK